ATGSRPASCAATSPAAGGWAGASPKPICNGSSTPRRTGRPRRRSAMTTNPATGKRCAIYLRVSSEGQARTLLAAIRAGATSVLDLDVEDNPKDSLPNQERECRAYAAARGWDIAGVYIEIDTSRHWEERKQLERLLVEARAGRVNVMLGWKLDRVLRDQ